jgi:hypothetical protein
MTLVLSCVAQEYVLQVCDRRLTKWPTGELVDDDTNKAVLLTNRVAFSFTGLAMIGGKQTDLWLTEVLSAGTSIGDAVGRVRSTATEAFHGMRMAPAAKRHAFVGTGWARFREGADLEPFYCTISNALDEHGRWLDRPREAFSARTEVLSPHAPFFLDWAGQAVMREEAIWAARRIRACVERDLSPACTAEFLAEALWRVAGRNTAVGPGLLLSSIPRAVVAAESPEVMALASAPTKSELCFLHIPADAAQTVTYGPNMASPGGAMITGFEVRTL